MALGKQHALIAVVADVAVSFGIRKENMIREAQIALPNRRGKGLRRLSLVMLMLAASLSPASQGSDRQHGAGKNRVSPELARLSDAVQHGNIKNQTIQVIVQFKEKPNQYHIQKMSKLGGRHLKQLNLVKGGVFKITLGERAAHVDDIDDGYV